MKNVLPIFAAFTWLVLVATRLWAQQGNAMVASGVPSVSAPSPSAMPANGGSISSEALVRRMVSEVDAHTSISALVRYKINLLGQSVIGAGSYRQQGRGGARMLRYDIRLQLSGQTIRQEQVCDGRQLWILEQQGEEKSLSKVDVTRVNAARPVASNAAPSNAWLALGGLPKLMSVLDRSFQFNQVNENLLGDLPVYTLTGSWRITELERLLKDKRPESEAGQPIDWNKLAPNVPDRVVVHVGRDDFFPYRIEYWRSEGAARPGDDDAQRILVVMELYEVQLNSPLDPREFAFEPGSLTAVDRTPAFLERLGLVESPIEGTARPKAAPRR